MSFAALVPLGLGAVMLIITLGVRAVTVNRRLRRKLVFVLLLSAVAIVAAAVRLLPGLSPDVEDQVSSVEHLLVALSIITFLVWVSLNPLRENRIRPGFPNIVQDAIIVGLFAIAGTVLLREKVLTTSAVGAVVVGFALQDTLGNAFSGLAIQTEKPFRVGQWIRVGEHEGCVEEVTWRATKLRTKANTFVIVPNNVMSREPIVNYSEPVIPTRISVEVGASYLVPPNEVKAAAFEAVANAPLALKEPPPEVLLVDFGSSAIVYRVRFWIQDYSRDESARDEVRTGIYYSFRRRGIEIPWPIQVEYKRKEPPARPADLTDRFADVLRSVAVFQSLDDEERRALASASHLRLYAKGEVVVREGEPGSSMFVVCGGEVAVTIGPDVREVNRIRAGGFFGEMSLLTGDARTATVTSVVDCELMELDASAFREFVLAKPAVLEEISADVIMRRDELEQRRAVVTGAATASDKSGFLSRVRRFLRLDSA